MAFKLIFYYFVKNKRGIRTQSYSVIMEQKKKKIIKHTLNILSVLAIGLFLLNLHLTQRLEKYLRKELIQRTTDATDGFYHLAFDDLSISFFKGELKLEGIKLAPDSAVFKAWAAKDSLPQMYVIADVDVIDFKGLNLTWTWNFKQLHFHSFEIKHPAIQVFGSSNSGRTEKKTKQAETKTLYEVISPYINVLSVKTLNLENASVAYTTENPLTPIIYALTDVSFHAYGFWLDKNSSQSGKLLYCDNFDFVTNQPQTLLTNNDFQLCTDSIRLSTEDSIIFIENIRLTPQVKDWKEKDQMPESSVDASIKTVEVQGIHFRREEGLNYLTARSFDIASSDVQFFNRSKDDQPDTSKKEKNKPMDPDSLVRSLSVYDIISPVLHSVSIQYIGIENAQLQYLIAVKDTVETYRLNRFNLQATDFLIDSVSEEKRGLWYSRNFAFQATDIEGLMNAHNHRFNIAYMALDTKAGTFCVDDIRLNPLSVRTRNDYMAGTIDSIHIQELVYDKGISAGLLKIDRPIVRYFVAPSATAKSKTQNKTGNNRVDVEGILNPFLQYLSVNKIKLNHAYLTLHDKSTSEPITYQLNNFNFFGTDIRVDENSGIHNQLFFKYSNLGFSFSDFDNYLPGKKYRLSLKKADFSTSRGELRLEDLKLIPQENRNKPDLSDRVQVETSLIRVTGLNRLPKNPTKNFSFASFNMDSPQIRINKTDHAQYALQLKKLSVKEMKWDSTWLKLGTIDLENPIASIYQGRPTDAIVHKASPSSSTGIYEALGSVARQITLERFRLKDANIDYTYFLKNDSLLVQKLDTTNFFIEGLEVDNVNHSFRLRDIGFSTRNLAIPLDHGFYTLKVGAIDLDNTSLKLDRLHLVSPYPMMEFAYFQPHHKDWFDVSVGSLSLQGIHLPAYFSDKILRIRDVNIQDVVLKNFKNQKIIVPRRIVPMVYTGLQKAPLKLDIERMDVTNFSVVYKELAKKGTEPGTLVITDMNGTFTGFTNVATRPDQFIELDANGLFMGKGYFTATWMLPVDSLNDCFLLDGHIQDFDLTALNELITPLASAEVESGHVKKMDFFAAATSKGATIDMLFLYNDLRAALLKEKNGELVDKKFLTRLANWILKHDNPDKIKSGYAPPRHSNVTIVRDPYHSTFNYLWQILQPALVESVGVSKKKQDVAKGFMGFISKVKKFFSPPKKQSQKDLVEVKEGTSSLPSTHEEGESVSTSH